MLKEIVAAIGITIVSEGLDATSPVALSLIIFGLRVFVRACWKKAAGGGRFAVNGG